jgi:DNA-binding MarR family transcriptional regulator
MEPSNDMPYRLMQAFFQLHRQKMNSGPVQGLNPGEMRVLRSIKRLDAGQGVMVSELSGQLKVSSPFITQMTNSLVKQGLADRSPDPADRRAVRLRVTPRGNQLIAKASREFIAHFEGLVQHLGPEQSGELLRLLHQVYQYFESVEVGKSD